MRSSVILPIPFLIGSLILAGLSGCAPEEEAIGVSRPRATPSPVSTTLVQDNQAQVKGGIKDRGAVDTSATNPPPPEPTPLPAWTPKPAASLSPVIVASPDPGTESTPTPDPFAP